MRWLGGPVSTVIVAALNGVAAPPDAVGHDTSIANGSPAGRSNPVEKHSTTASVAAAKLTWRRCDTRSTSGRRLKTSFSRSRHPPTTSPHPGIVEPGGGSELTYVIFPGPVLTVGTTVTVGSDVPVSS